MDSSGDSLDRSRFHVSDSGSPSSRCSSPRRMPSRNASPRQTPPLWAGGSGTHGFPSNELRDDAWREEGEHMTNPALINTFRRAVNDRQRLERLVSESKCLPEVAWRKALLWACASGHVEFLSTLLRRSSPELATVFQTARDADGFTGLHRAVVAGQKEVVKFLTREEPLDCFAILQARTPEGWTAVHLAVVAGEVEILRILVEAYGMVAPANSEQEWNFRDRVWLTPLHYAVLGRKVVEMEMLLRWKAYDRHVNAHDYFMRTPLHMASCHPGAPIDLVLSNRQVDINAVDCCFFTPLHWAVKCGNTEAVRSLLSLAPERSIRANEENIDGKAPFQFAIENPGIDRRVSRDIERLLLTCGEVRDEIDMLYRDRQLYVDGANAMFVGAALIASVTFGGWLQPPMGDGSGQSHMEVRVFWVTNSLSFFFSVATVMAGAGTVVPMEDAYIGQVVKKFRRGLALTCILLIISVVFVLFAFSAAGSVSLRSVGVKHLREEMILTTVIGAVVSVLVLAWFLFRLYKIRPDWRQVFHNVRAHHANLMGMSNVWSFQEIQRDLEAAERRMQEDIEKEKGKGKDRERDRRQRMDLIELVDQLQQASEKAERVRHSLRAVNLQNPNMGLAEDGKRPVLRLHNRDQAIDQQMQEFEEAYMNLSCGDPQVARFHMEVLGHVSARGLHHWIKRFPSHNCREHSLKKDKKQWKKIHQKVQDKTLVLEEECRKFDYGTITFDEWSA